MVDKDIALFRAIFKEQLQEIEDIRHLLTEKSQTVGVTWDEVAVAQARVYALKCEILGSGN